MYYDNWKNPEAILRVIMLYFFTFFAVVCKTENLDTSMLFQYSTINALAEGHYSSDFSIKELLEHGDFGLGTFDGLDGEMFIESGKVFQIRSNGKIIEVGSHSKTPFAVVTSFQSDLSKVIQYTLPFELLCSLIDDLRISNNYMFGIRVKGTFSNIVTRSVPKQKDGVRLVEVVKEQQVVFQRQQPIKGILIGFYFPSYMKDINVTGYHFHFLSDDRTIGGHVLGIQLENGVIELNQIDHFSIQLPKSTLFSQLSIMETKDEELYIIEKKND